MKAILPFFPVLAAASLLYAAAGPVASAQTSVTVISSAPYTITKPGYYLLGADLSYAGRANAEHDAIITVAANNVTLDFAGHTISGPAASNKASHVCGVYTANHGFVTVQNGVIANCWIGIQILFGPANGIAVNVHNRINNMSVTRCLFEGINLNQTTAMEVSDCRISFIGGSTTDSGYAAGIDVNEGYASRIVNNNITNVTGTYNVFGITVGASDIYATGNTISNITGGNFYAGLRNVSYAVGNTVTNSQYGLFYDQPGKYKDNLTRNCTTPFGGTEGTDAGGNN